ncbi:hypothetical protein LEP1GSC050_1865 [Leptospira broomii serovar Hurstbridge str. 5399]|uniref:Uncharacterized protein n=1 Tax=Leptospira broomii serovar Hurstbridge str. 5399 TaxID=1049789 RepID=T0GEC5_9LEPT|nr:hypothetical protein LEP1GSC050_1865 [Leptospira broomii serovar Hurstbridge str. 5399]
MFALRSVFFVPLFLSFIAENRHSYNFENRINRNPLTSPFIRFTLSRINFNRTISLSIFERNLNRGVNCDIHFDFLCGSLDAFSFCSIILSA